ncbi:MAG: hypothetical protein NT076_01340 [Candidatus Pacearchaeota archaeon]|nr:hypothetical protein [Candidatus Pacearchaeota archaeon]
MSFERAAVNCRRCYQLAVIIREDAQKLAATPPARVVIPKEQNKSDSLYSARNEAMKAIEDLLETGNCTPAEAALAACEGCDYSVAKISEHYIAMRKKELESAVRNP